jgi:hypothetical protein
MTKIEPSVLRRIANLLKHAESAGQLGSQAEAVAFTEKANELLLKYKLGRDDLELAEGVHDPVTVGEGLNAAVRTDVGKGSNSLSPLRNAPWFEMLAHTVAKHNFCRTLRAEGVKTVWIVGRKHDREVVEYLIRTLTDTAWKLATEHYYEVRADSRKRGVPMPVKPKQSFLMGFVIGIDTALQESRRRANSNPHALVVIKRSEEELDEAMKDYGTHTSAKNPLDELNMQSVMVGIKAGQAAQVTGGIKGSTTTKSLGGV